MKGSHVAWLISTCGEVIEYAERAGVPGNYARLRRRHAVVRGRFDRGAIADELVLRRFLHLEVRAWHEVLRHLEDDVLGFLAERLAPDRSGVWAELDTRRTLHATANVRLRGAIDSCERSLQRYREAPSSRRIAESLAALDEVVAAATTPTPFTAAELRSGLDDLASPIERFPPALREFLSLRVEHRFYAYVKDESLIHALGSRPQTWTPSWEQLHPAPGPAEACERWFVDDVQTAYEAHLHAWEIEWAHGEALAEHARRIEVARREEERLLEESRQLEEREAMEINTAHAEALAEDERRTAAAQAEQDRREAERRAHEAEEFRVAHVERLRTDDAYLWEYAKRLAPDLVSRRLSERGITLKAVVASDRVRLLHEAAEELAAGLRAAFRGEGR